MAHVYKRKDRRRSKCYWYDFIDANGQKRRLKGTPSKRVTEELLNDKLNKVAREEHLGIVDDTGMSFARFTEIWADRILPQRRPGTAGRWQEILDLHLKPAFKGSLRSIKLGAVESYMAERLQPRPCDRCDGKKKVSGRACSRCAGTGERKGAAPATVNRELAVLRHILKRAVAWKYLGRYPLEGLKLLKEPSGRTRFLTEEEIDQLLAACGDSRSPYLKPFALVALNTGMRRGEILSLTRRSIDWQNRVATLSQTKNGETRPAHLNDTAFEALKSLPTRLDGRLFPFKDDHAVSRAFRRAVERAGIEDFHLHDLRHTFASYQAMGGMSSRGLQGLLGHKDGRMTLRYSHLSDAFMKAAVNRVNLGAASPASEPKAAANPA